MAIEGSQPPVPEQSPPEQSVKPVGIKTRISEGAKNMIGRITGLRKKAPTEVSQQGDMIKAVLDEDTKTRTVQDIPQRQNAPDGVDLLTGYQDQRRLLLRLSAEKDRRQREQSEKKAPKPEPAVANKVPEAIRINNEYDPEVARDTLRQFQDMIVDTSIKRLLSETQMSDEYSQKIKEWSTFGPTEIADSLLLSEFPFNTLDSTDQFAVKEAVDKVGLKMYLSFVRGLQHYESRWLRNKRDPEVQAHNAKVQENKTKLFTSLVAEKPLDNIENLVTEGAALLDTLRQDRNFAGLFGEATDILQTLGKDLASGKTGNVLIDINRLKQVHHHSGLLSEYATNDIVGTSFVESLSTCTGVNDNIYRTYASSDAKRLVGKLFHKYPQLDFYKKSLTTGMDEQQFFDYDTGPWKTMFQTGEARHQEGDEKGMSTAAIYLMAPASVVERHEMAERKSDAKTPKKRWEEQYRILQERILRTENYDPKLVLKIEKPYGNMLYPYFKKQQEQKAA